MNPKVCVVIPTYNEAENLLEIVTQLFSLAIPFLRIIIVDDASPDGTGDLADSIAVIHRGQIQVLHRPMKTGIGPAYVAGFKAALKFKPDIIVQMDADLSHPPDAIPMMLNEFASADVVIGSRYVVGGAIDGGWGWRRRVLSWCGNAYARAVAGVLVRDASSGFKAFRREVIESLPLESLQCKGFGFQAEVIIAQPQTIGLIAIPLLIQTYGIFFIAYTAARSLNLSHRIAAPACLIGTSNFFELAVAVAISLFGLDSGAALATVVGVLVEVPVMLSLVYLVNRTKHFFEP